MSSITQNSTLLQSHANWANRPDDQRFTSLPEMHAMQVALRDRSASRVVANRKITAVPGADPVRDLMIEGPSGAQFDVSNWAFGQLATLAGAPAGYLRTLPAAIAADAINYGLHYSRDVEETGLLLSRGESGGSNIVRAATGPRYGRVWDADVTAALMRAFGDGVSGRFRVPGSFSGEYDGSKRNTTLYASDRDMWVFLADQQNKIELPNRRDGQPGMLSRGVIAWNSEVGGGTLGLCGFLFDFMCCNHYIWGATQIEEVRIRHSAGAPERYVEQFLPAVESFIESGTQGVVASIEDARAKRLDNVGEWLMKRFGAKVGQRVAAAHVADEGRPIETVWDVVVGATAYARDNLTHTGERVTFEREVGALLDA